jgi:HlyD family secretion protein
LAIFLVVIVTSCSRSRQDGYQGYLEGKFVYVASPQSGRLEYLAVERGDTIETGHALFELDHQPEADEALQAERLLRTARSHLSDLETGRRPAEVDVTRAQLQEALADKKRADEILARDEAQYRSGGISQIELIEARGTAELSAAKVEEMRAALDVDALPAREHEIEAQINQVAADRATLSSAEWKLQQKKISSPRRGLIFDTLYREGEWVAAGNPVIQLLPPENIEIRFFVPEPVIGSLRVGQEIHTRCDGCSTTIGAKIAFISPQNEYTPPVIYSNENRSKLVYLIIAKPSSGEAAHLHPGQPVEVTLR